MSTPSIMIMAGGTGGHIMPGLAVAALLQSRGWRVYWMGHPERMEGRLVPQHGVQMLPLRFAGVRGKNIGTLLKLPFTLLSALLQARRNLIQTRPDVVLGMGGYVAFPGGIAARCMGVPLVVHEQNAVAGTANRYLAKMATRALVGFPGALPGAVMVGNPVRAEFLAASDAQTRYSQRRGPLKLLVVGGSLGAAALNTVVPAAMGLIAPELRPIITHQAGEQHLESLRHAYAQLDVQANCQAFIQDMAAAMQNADLVICRAGAMTVAEVAASGVAALFIPLPHAIDDHQTANARYLSECSGAWQHTQEALTAEWLAQWVQSQSREKLMHVAIHAQEHAQLNATQLIADACQQVAGRGV